MPDYLRLNAAITLYPEMGLTTSSLRRERDRGNLRTYIIAGKEFTTREDMKVMIERCAVQKQKLKRSSRGT